MGPALSSFPPLVPKRFPLAYLLKYWKELDPKNIKKKILTFLCTKAWPKYPLGDEESWSPEGCIHYNTVLQLDLFSKREEKWTKIPYAQLFFSLETIQSSSISAIWTPRSWLWSTASNHLRKLRAKTLCKQPKAKYERSKDPPQLTATASPLLPSHPVPPHGCYPLQQEVTGRGRIYVSFQLSELKEMKMNLGNYTDNLDLYHHNPNLLIGLEGRHAPTGPNPYLP
jgi:hypothetical protein